MTVLWESVLDGKYKCIVEQKDEYYGVLTIKEGGKTLRQMQVSMTYSPIFGPDISDISEWSQLAIDYIDNMR